MDAQQQSQSAQEPKELPSPGQNRQIFGILSYLGPLVIVSYLLGNTDSFVKFHVKQGLVVFAIEIIAWILVNIFWTFFMLLNLVNLATLVLSVIGIINVIQNKENELPVVGQFAKNFTI